MRTVWPIARGRAKAKPVDWDDYNRKVELFSSTLKKIQEGGRGLSEEEKKVWEESNRTGLDFYTCEDCGRYCLMYGDDRLICEDCSIKERASLGQSQSKGRLASGPDL